MENDKGRPFDKGLIQSKVSEFQARETIFVSNCFGIVDEVPGSEIAGAVYDDLSRIFTESRNAAAGTLDPVQKRNLQRRADTARSERILLRWVFM